MVVDLSSRHPEYSTVHPDWELMRDAYKGERQVKTKGTLYLPPTSGHIEDGLAIGVNTIGFRAYSAYKMRARFPNFVREAVQMAVGMMHSQPPRIQLPVAMEEIRSSKGERIPQLLRRINTEQLVTGRIGLLADLPSNPLPGLDLPYISTYIPERIINWDDGAVDQLVPQELNFVVLDESEYERNFNYAWQVREKYRVLSLGRPEINESRGLYRQGVFDPLFLNANTGTQVNRPDLWMEQQMRAPTWRGRTLDRIPFVIINSCDINPDVDDPPLLDLGRLCMTIYRSDADYRQNLFMQGQDTLVVIGGAFDEDQPVRTGAGSRIDLPMNADAKYIGVESSGLQEQRESLQNLERRAGSMGAQTLDTTSRERESGDSLRIRVAARTADMNQIVETAAEGLSTLLKRIAVWIGENPEEVIITPNKEFGEMPLTGQTMVEIATAKNLGWPISERTMHELSVRRRISARTYEEEIAEATREKTSVFKPPIQTGDRSSENQVRGNNGT